MSRLVTIRGDTLRTRTRDGDVVRSPLRPEYEWLDALPTKDAIGILASDVEEFGDFDWDAVEPDLHAALSAYYKRTQEMAALGIEARGIELASHMLEQGEPDAQFIVPGLIAREQVTLISGREKLSGKSTLTAYLMGALERGEETVFGPALGRTVKTVWLTEEPDFSLFEKAERFGLGGGVVIVRNYALAALDFKGKLALLEDVAKRCKAELVVVDPFSRVAKVEEESGMEPGRRGEEASDFAQRTSLAVVLIHHNRKGTGGPAEDAFRGSTSLTAAMDIVVQVDRRVKKGPAVRRLTTWGRVEASNWTRDIELVGSRYTGGPDEAAGDELMLSEPMTVRAFAGKLNTSPDTARRRLAAMVERGNATVDEGVEPYVYSPVLAA
jgi:hypothetical protein